MLSERCQTKNEYIIHDSIHISFRKCKGTYSDRKRSVLAKGQNGRNYKGPEDT